MNTHRIIQPLREAYPGCANAHLNTLITTILHDGVKGASEYVDTFLPELDRSAADLIILLVVHWVHEGVTSVYVNE